MRKKHLRLLNKLICLLLCISLLLPAGVAQAGIDWTNGYTTLSIVKNNLLMAGVDPVNGRFLIRTLEGDPTNNVDFGMDLLTAGKTPNSQGQWGAESSFTTFRIDGENYIFGNDYGFLGFGNNVVSNQLVDEQTHKTVWKVKGLEATQTITVPSDELDPKAGLVKINYTIKNTSGVDRKVGVRPLLDIAAGDSDCPEKVLFPGPTGEVQVEHEYRYSGEAVPDYWRTESRYGNTPLLRHTYGLLRDIGDKDPDRIVVGHWKNLKDNKWDYTPDPELDFTTTDNSYQTGDAAVAIYWEPVVLQPGEAINYATHYGVGMGLVSKNPLPPENVEFPARVELTPEGDAYRDFEVDINFENTYNETIKNISVMLVSPGGITVKDYRRAGAERMLYDTEARRISELYPADGATVTATVAVDTMKNETYLHPFQIIYAYTDSETGEQEGGVYDYQVIVPPVENWPSLTFTGLTPDNVFYKEPGVFRVTGSGFNNLEVGSIGQSGDMEIVLQNTERSENRIAIPNHAINVVNDNLLTFLIPEVQNANSRLKMDEKYHVSIKTREDSIVGSHIFNATITASSEEKYKNKDYGILLIYRDTDTNVHEMVVFDNERELDNFYRQDQYQGLIDIRGSISGNKDNGFAIGDGGMINRAVVYSAPEDHPGGKMFINKYSQNGGQYIKLEGNGILSVHDTEVINDSFSLELEDGKAYTYSFPMEDPWGEGTDWGDGVSEEEFLPIEIRRENQLVDFAKTIGGWLVSIKDIKLRSDGVSLGGSMGFFAGDLGAGIEVEDIRYSASGYEGIKASPTVGVPTGLIPGIDLGGSGTLMIDTIENMYGLEVDFEFQILNGNGTLIFKVPVEDNTIYTPYPDTIDFEISGKPGFPVLPPTVLFNIVRGGAGIHNISTLSGDQRDNSALPWVEFTGGIADPTGKILSGDPVEIYVSKNRAEVKGTVSIVSLNLADAVLSILDSPETGIRIAGEGGLNILDLLEGRAKLYIGYNAFNYDNPLRPIDLGGNGKVSGTIFGYSLADAFLGISNENVYIRGKAFGVLDIGAKYIWKDNAIHLLASTGTATPVEGNNEYVYKEGANGEKLVIDNFKQVASSKLGKRSPKYLASRDSDPPHLASLLATAAKEHQITINQTGKLLLKIACGESVPGLTLTKPGGSGFQLIEDKNYFQSEENGEKIVFILLERPETGAWQLSSGSPVDYELIQVAELPVITGLDVISRDVDAQQGDSIDLMLETNLGKGLSTRLYLSKDVNDAGRLVGEYDITENNCAIKMEIPGDLSSGNYYVRAELIKDGSNVDSMYSNNTVLVSSIHTPVAPGRVQLENVGSNRLKVIWDSIDEKAKGYYIEILDEDGQPLPNTGAAYHERREGATQETFIAGRWESNGRETGLVDGDTYKVAVTAVNNVVKQNGQGDNVEATYTSSPTGSNTLVFREANYPQLDFILKDAAGNLKKGMVQGKEAYLTGDGEIAVQLKTSENADLKIIREKVKVSGGEEGLTREKEELGSNEGTSLKTNLELQEGNNVLLLTARNAAGDATQKAVMVHVDTTPPVLMIDSPEQGQIIEGDRVNVSGFAEPGSRVTVNGRLVKTKQDGIFTGGVTMAGSQSKIISVEAEDDAGNTSAFETKVMKAATNQLQSIRIDLAASRIEQHKSVQLQVYGTYNDSSEIVIDNSNINWSIPSGEEYANISSEGELTIDGSGPVFVKASYPLTGSFALEDIRKLSVGEVKIEANTYNVTYYGNGNTGGSVPIDSVNYEKGDTVRVLGNTGNLVKNGYIFNGWNAIIGGNTTLYSTGDTFCMGNANAILYADWIPHNGTDDGGDNDSDDGGDTGRKNNRRSSPLPKPGVKIPSTGVTAISSKDGRTVTVSTTVTSTIGEVTGKASAKVEAKVLEELIAKIKETEKEQKTVVEIIVDSPPKTNEVTIEIDKDAFKKLPETGNTGLKVNTAIATAIFDKKAVEKLGGAAPGGNIGISMDRVDNKTLPSRIKAKVGNRPVYDFTARVGTTAISDFGGGKVNISIPYTPAPGEKKNSIIVYYISDEGNLKTVRGRYDEETGTVDFKTSHFSNFAVGYNEVNFDDVAGGAWYSEAVGFMAARNIVNGIGGERFAPRNNVTMADFLVMVMNSYDIELDSYVAGNFSDAGDTYYTPYLGTAKRLGLVAGIGNNLYHPEATISHQDMFVILYRMLEKMGELPEGKGSKPLESFGDASEISGYAVEAMKLFVETGIIAGKGERLSPKATSKRLEVVYVLYKLLSK